MLQSLSLYDIDQVTGFLPAQDPLTQLPPYFAAWDALGARLPALLLAGRARSALERMPLLDSARLDSARECERALLLHCTFVNAYVWGEAEATTRIPRAVAVPVCQLAERMGRKPIIHHASGALQNWRRLDPEGGIELENLALLQGFLTSSDEAWFVLVAVLVEARGAPALPETLRAREAARTGDVAALTGSLERIAQTIQRMEEALARTYEKCDPYIFYHRVRPFFAGWDAPGMIYEGVSEKPVRYVGGSAGQSPLVQSLDAALGVRHLRAESRPYIAEMREYMAPAHRRFVQTLEEAPHIAEFVQERQADSPHLRDSYNRCIDRLDSFRRLHLKIAVDYITRQAATGEGSKGTGGTDLRAFLGTVKKETREHRL